MSNLVIAGLTLSPDPSARTESYYLNGLVTLDLAAVEALKAKLVRDGTSTIRLCLHPDRQSRFHEMLIVHRKTAVAAVHMHPEKDESYHVIEGAMTLRIHDEKGGVLRSLKIGALGSGAPFMARVPRGTWHATVPETEFVVYHESRPGPFEPGDSVTLS